MNRNELGNRAASKFQNIHNNGLKQIKVAIFYFFQPSLSY